MFSSVLYGKCTQRDEMSGTVASKRDVSLQSQITPQKRSTIEAARAYLDGAGRVDVYAGFIGRRLDRRGRVIVTLSAKLAVVGSGVGSLAQTKNSALTSTASTKCTQRDEMSGTVASKRDVSLQSQITPQKRSTIEAARAYLDGAGRVDVYAGFIGRRLERRGRAIVTLSAKLAVVILDHGSLAQTNKSVLTSTASTGWTQRDKTVAYRTSEYCTAPIGSHI